MQATQPKFDLITSLENLQRLAQGLSNTDFRDGYSMAMEHAIDLARIYQLRLEVATVSSQTHQSEVA